MNKLMELAKFVATVATIVTSIEKIRSTTNKWREDSKKEDTPS